MRLSNFNKVLAALMIAAIGASTAFAYYSSGNHGSMKHQREHFLAYRQAMVSQQMMEGDYACCLAKPCTYCIEKTPEHGEGATCNCLDDVVNGRHPCGECIGEILEGHGNPFLAKFFARAVAEEVGQEYYTPLTGIIEDKYGKPAAEQL